jgi:hypothetical protein
MSKSNKLNSSSSSSSSRNKNNSTQHNSASSYNTVTKPKTSYIDELDEDQINEDKAEHRYEAMMKNFKKLTRMDDNDEENENMNKFYKENAPKKRNDYKVPDLKAKQKEEEDDESGRNGIRAPNELKEEVLVIFYFFF